MLHDKKCGHQIQWNISARQPVRFFPSMTIYVRLIVNRTDEYENFSTPTAAATSFLFSLAGNRTKSTFMPILGFINTVLRSYVSLLVLARSLLNILFPFSNAAPPQRFGALNMTAALGPFIMRHPEVKNNMEQFMLQHVAPEFTSTEPYLRAIVSTFFIQCYLGKLALTGCVFRRLKF
jgi:hypothetical protein